MPSYCGSRVQPAELRSSSFSKGSNDYIIPFLTSSGWFPWPFSLLRAILVTGSSSDVWMASYMMPFRQIWVFSLSRLRSCLLRWSPGCRLNLETALQYQLFGKRNYWICCCCYLPVTVILCCLDPFFRKQHFAVHWRFVVPSAPGKIAKYLK